MTAASNPQKVNSSPFVSAIPTLTEEDIINQLSAHIRRLRHNQRHASCSPSSSSTRLSSDFSSASHDGAICDVSGSSSGIMMTDAVADSAGFNLLSMAKPRQKEERLFTLREVELVCERMLKEREEELVEEYDKLLAAKLSEQYETFRKFNQDQLHRIFGESAASYVS